jgi:hypothetical protein
VHRKNGTVSICRQIKKITPLKLQKLQAEQYRQSFPKDYRYSIQRLNEAGKLSPKNLERVRAENHDLEHDIHISEQSALIKELDAVPAKDSALQRRAFLFTRKSG